MTHLVSIRNIDPLGRIVIPSKIRLQLDINEGDEVGIIDGGDRIILKKLTSVCIPSEQTKSEFIYFPW